MVELTTIYYIVEIAVGITIIGGTVYGLYRWAKGRKDDDGEEEKIACKYCQTVFTPDYQEGTHHRDGTIDLIAECPTCGEENKFPRAADEEDSDDKGSPESCFV